MKIGYVRVSTVDQNEGRQIEAMKDDGVEKIYMDKKSGKNFDRPEYQKMISELKAGDIVVIHSIDRLGRNYDEIINQWMYITKKLGVNIIVQDNPILSASTNKELSERLIADMVLLVYAYVAQQERDLNLQRQAEGIALAKLQGKYKGRVKKKIDEKLFTELLEQYKANKLTAVDFSKRINVSRATLYNIFKERGIRRE